MPRVRDSELADLAPETRQPGAVAPTLAPSVAALLQVQRSAGVTRPRRRWLVRRCSARDPPTATTPESAFDDAVKASSGRPLCGRWPAMDAPTRDGRIDGAMTELLVPLSQAAETVGDVALRNQLAAKLQEPQHAGRAAQIMRDNEYNAALAVPDWQRVVRALNAYEPNDISGKLGPMPLEQLNHICDAGRAMGAGWDKVLTPAEALRVRKLGDAWRAAYGGWDLGAGGHARAGLQRHRPADRARPSRLRSDLGALPAGRQDAAGVPAGAHGGRADPGPEARRRLPGRGGCRDVAARPAAASTPTTTPDLLPQARYIGGKGRDRAGRRSAAAATQFADDNNRVRRTLSFLGVEPLTGSGVRPANAPAGMTPGTAEPGVAAGGGYGHVHVRGHLRAARWRGRSTTCTASATPVPTPRRRAGFQFIARNIEKFDAAGTSLGFHTGSWTPSGQGARNFSSSAAPGWYLDTPQQPGAVLRGGQ